MPSRQMIHLAYKRAAAVLSILVICVGTASAQSGRKNTGGSTTTTVAPSVSGPKPVEKKPEVSKRIQLLVGTDKHQAFANIPYYLYDTVLDSCIRRLGEADIVMPTSAGGDFDRAAAIRAAKQETVRYVVLLNLGSEYADAGKQVRNGQDELYVDFVMFQPETAKIKTSGRAHQHIYQSGRVGIGQPKSGAVYSEYAVKQAAIEIANRILAAFDIKIRGEGPF
jgi:hypothetical protein